MDLNQQTSNMPAYYIYRDTSSSEPFDPTAPLHFFPPKDSDDLFFALLAAFPGVTTHSERMRNAVIQFFLEESQAQQASTQASPLNLFDDSMTMQSASTSPQSSWHSQDQYTSSSSSASPFIGNSPGSTTSPTDMSISTQASTSKTQTPIESMTGVFSLTSTAQPTVRSRRRMTESEKVEYRKRRSAGACDQCSARKRKCKHNKDVSRSSASAASNKSRPTGISKKAQGKQPEPVTAPSRTLAPAPMPTMPEVPLPQDLLSFDDAELFPTDSGTDWAFQDLGFEKTSLQNTFNDLSGLDMLVDDHTLFERQSQDFAPSITAPQPTHTFHTHAAQSPLRETSHASSPLTAISNTTSEAIPSGRQERHVYRAVETSPIGFVYGPAVAAPTSPGPSIVRSPSGLSGPASAPPGSEMGLATSYTSSTASHSTSPLRSEWAGIGVPDDSGDGRLLVARQGISTGNTILSPIGGRSVSANSQQSALQQSPAPVLAQSASAVIVPARLRMLGTQSVTGDDRPADLPRTQSMGTNAAFSTVQPMSISPSIFAPIALSPAERARRVNLVSPISPPATPRPELLLAKPTGPETGAQALTDGHESDGLGLQRSSTASGQAQAASGTSAGTSPNGLSSDGRGFTGLSLQEFLFAIGEVQKCILCAMVASLPAVWEAEKRVDRRHASTSTPRPGAAMDDLAGLCGRKQIAAC